MKIYINENMIRRNKRIGQITTIVSLAVLAIGLVLSFRNEVQTFTLSLVALLIGFILSQVGIYFTNRWGRTPRPDQQLTAALKGLEDKYSLYHYTTPVSHLLVGPAGVWILLPYSMRGRISYENGRWKQRGGNVLMKFFAQEGLGRPDLEIKASISDLQRFLEKALPEEQVPPINAALVFTNQQAQIEVEDSPYPTLSAEKLKDFIRRKGKASKNGAEKIALVQQILEQNL
jgi:hypothetical protein